MFEEIEGFDVGLGMFQSINVMDYSLLVGVDEQRQEMVFGIVDYLRQYTWDKQLETWVKSSLVVPKNTSPPPSFPPRITRSASASSCPSTSSPSTTPETATKTRARGFLASFRVVGCVHRDGVDRRSSFRLNLAIAIISYANYQ